MFDISDITVKYWASDECYKEAVKYYENSMVNNVQIKRHFNPLYNANFTNINAEVKDNNSIIHNVFILFNDKTGIVSISCDCMDVKKKHSNDNICEHIAAVLIKYARDKEQVIEGSKDVYTKKFIGKLKNSILDDNASGKPLNIEVKYEYSQVNTKKSSIEFKIGEDKLYIVKDVEQFLKAITRKQEVIEYGKKFTYNPKKYYIKDEDKDLINF
ncbi:SWIM zinc finger family protein [Clostridium sp. DMHC 10]|nr:SWIM zinc finger family protein [Clostridium sp. DMHC 10]